MTLSGDFKVTFVIVWDFLSNYAT